MHATTTCDWLRLHLLLAGDNRLFLKLIKKRAEPGFWLGASARAWLGAGAGADQLRAASQRMMHLERDYERSCETLQAQDVQLLPMPDPRYPSRLLEIADPPPLLYVRGDLARLSMPMLAIVGSRKASLTGEHLARVFAKHLSKAGLGLCSGLALGIDGAVHNASLDTGGYTAAVMATGIDLIYPRQHRMLAQTIAERGSLLSENLPGTAPAAARFPQRNRIVSGLCLGVLVVEAALRSGSMITARLALEQNREVFAIPHAPQYPQGEGCNHLLRQGACLVAEPDHVLAELGHMVESQAVAIDSPASDAVLDPELQMLLQQMGDGPVLPDQLLSAGRLDTAGLQLALTELRSRGLIALRGGYYQRL